MGISNFYDLETWKKAHKLVLLIYKLTSKYPKKETYILVSQMLRSAISVASNVAEGFGRNGIKEKVQFYTMSKASLIELQNQLLISKDIKYLNSVKFNKAWELSVEVHKLVNGLIRSTKKSKF